MTDQPGGIERRKFPRTEASFTVVYNVKAPGAIRLLVGDKEIFTIAIDISEEGMAILSDYELPDATTVAINFVVLDETAIRAEDRRRPIKIQGETTSCLLTKNKSHRLGIHFINIPAEDRRFLANFVKISK